MNSRKIVAAVLSLAVAGTAASAIGLAACKKKGGETGRTIYVSVNGKEGATGSKNDPRDIFSTLDGAYYLQPGDTVLIEPGVYNLDKRIEIETTGEYNKYITIKNADPTKKAVLSFYDMAFASTNRGVQIYGNYFHWDGVDIRGAGDNGMYIGGSYNIIENSEFYDNRDTGLQLGRSYSPVGDEHKEFADINYWPSYNLIKNCTSYNNYDNETYGENADGFAAKLTVGYGNVFDGCIAYRNSDDGWDLFAKTDSGNIGMVIMYNCVAFENGYILETREEFNAKFKEFDESKAEGESKENGETYKSHYRTRDGDGNGFKLGGSVMEGEVFLYNCLAFNNRMHGVTDNSNPGVITVDGVTAYNNGAGIGMDGKIRYVEGNGVKDGSGNIDLARHDYSYNHVANVLSVNNGNDKISNDAYRGTIENSTFQAIKGINKVKYTVEGQAEYNTKTGDNGVQGAPDAATDLFKALPDLGFGLSTTLHKDLRNADNSINMGDLLALKNADGTQGSKLNKSSWNDYVHYDFHDLSKCKSKDEADAQAIIDMAYLPIRVEACYQNFELVTKIMNTDLVWTSGDSSIINVTDIKGTSNSNHSDVKVEVLRPIDADKKVTLTATVTVGKVTKNKTFEVNVKKNTFRVGEFVIEGLEGDAIIVDKQENPRDYRVPVPKIINGTSNSNAVISTEYYDRVPYVYYASYDNPNDFTEQSWDATKPGIWRITENITLFDDKIEIAKAADGSGPAPKIVTKEYRIYIAARDASIDFKTNAAGEKVSSLSVYKDGYTISGEFKSPTGYIYSLSLPDTAAAPTAEEIKANSKTVKTEFRSTATSFNFPQENKANYSVYYFLENLDGTAKSEIYKKDVAVKNISTKAEFEQMLAFNDSSTVYLLTQDIDMSGSITTSEVPFLGVLNGNGHKVYNVNLTNSAKYPSYGLFIKVKGGTIMNVTFENVVIDDKAENDKTGIIGEMEGGYISNVQIHNIDINVNFFVEDATTGEQKPKRVSNRVGGLIGQVFSTGGLSSTTYIDRVSVINDKDDKGNYLHTIRGNERVSALVGYVQNGNGSGWTVLYITNCYVDVLIDASRYGGGIVGRSDDRNANDVLEITNCVFMGQNRTAQDCGGILGGFTGGGRTRIYSCVSFGDLYYTGEQYLVSGAEKNCSNIVGSYAANGDMEVDNCYAKFRDHNDDYNVTSYGASMIARRMFWNGFMRSYDNKETHFSTVFDFENVWELVADSDEGDALKAPYVRLR